MDWLTVLWLVIIVASVIFILFLEGYVRKRRNNRRLGILSDVPIGNFTGRFSSGNSLAPKFGGGSGGGAGTARSFAASTTESAGVADARLITVNSIVTVELKGDMVSDEISGNLLQSADTVASIIEPTVAIDTAANLLSTTIDIEGAVPAVVEFMTDAAGNAIESAAEVAGEIVSEIISNN